MVCYPFPKFLTVRISLVSILTMMAILTILLTWFLTCCHLSSGFWDLIIPTNAKETLMLSSVILSPRVSPSSPRTDTMSLILPLSVHSLLPDKQYPLGLSKETVTCVFSSSIA